MIILYTISVLLILASAVLNLAAMVIRMKRRKHNRCKDCYYCKPIPPEAGAYFHSMERHCALHRGTDEEFVPHVHASVVTVDDYCSRFIPKEGMEKAYV